MKKSLTLFLSGVIILLSAVLVGVLVFMKNQPPQQRAFESVVNIKPMEPDSSIWGQNFPNQWSSLQRPPQIMLTQLMVDPLNSRGLSVTRAR